MDKLHQKIGVLTYLKKQKEMLDQKFYLTLERDFSVEKGRSYYATWPDWSWQEFESKLKDDTDRLKSICMTQDWMEYFALMKEKAQKITKDIELTRQEINELK